MSDYNNGDNNNSNGGEQGNGYVEKFIGDLRNRLTGKRLHGATQDPVLSPDWYENNLGFVVKTNVPDDQTNNGRVRFGADNQTSGAALMVLVKMVLGDEFVNRGKGPTEDLSYAFTRDLPAYGDKPVKEVNRLQVGRKNGRYYITILEENRPQAVFFFGPSKHHRVFVDGQPATEDVSSGLYALSWATNLINGIPALQEKYYEEVSTLMERWAQKKGGQGGGFKGKKQWNNGGQNGGGYQKKQWNGNGQGGGGGYQKKQWNNNNNGNGYKKKQWNNNGSGYNKQGGGGYNNNQGDQGGYNNNSQGSDQNFDDQIPF